MTKSIGMLLLAGAVLTFAPRAEARRSVPIQDIRDQAIVTGTGAAVSTDQVRRAVMLGAADAGWTSSDAEGDKVVARTVVRGKHTAIVEIGWTAKTFSVVYKDSVNLNHEIWDGRPLIHPNYNVWARKLAEAIQKRLLEL